MRRLFLIAVILAMSVGSAAADPRPGSKKGLYICSELTGGGFGALDALDITAASDPNSYDLIDGDLAIVGNAAGFKFYVFDGDSTAAAASPDAIRPEDFDTAGVWIRDMSLASGTMAMAPVTYAVTALIAAADLYGKKLDNYDQAADAVVTLPAAAAGMNALYETVDISNAVTLRPPSGGQLLFVDATGALTLLDSDEGVTCAAADAVVGQELRITTYQTGSATYGYKIVQTIGNGFAQEIP